MAAWRGLHARSHCRIERQSNMCSFTSFNMTPSKKKLLTCPVPMTAASTPSKGPSKRGAGLQKAASHPAGAGAAQAFHHRQQAIPYPAEKQCGGGFGGACGTTSGAQIGVVYCIARRAVAAAAEEDGQGFLPGARREVRAPLACVGWEGKKERGGRTVTLASGSTHLGGHMAMLTCQPPRP